MTYDEEMRRYERIEYLYAAAHNNPMGHASMALSMADTVDDAIAEYDRIIAELTTKED